MKTYNEKVNNKNIKESIADTNNSKNFIEKENTNKIDQDLDSLSSVEKDHKENLQVTINNLNLEIEKLQNQLNDQKDKILRTFAELDNVRKRSHEDVAKARKFGIEAFAESLIPVKDSIEAALFNYNGDINIVKEGLDVTLKQINASFEKNFLKEIFPQAGDKFDPHMHQAISSVASDQPNNSIINVLQKGYVIHDRIIRPALVSVSSGPDINSNK